MSQSKTPASGTNVFYFDSNQILTTRTIPGVQGVVNNLLDGVEILEISDATTPLDSYTLDSVSSDFLWRFTAKDKGRIRGIVYKNGGVAVDSQVGWELSFINETNSNAQVAYFGFGGGTEAVKATDKTSAVSASAVATLENSLTSDSNHFNKGDVISVTADRDGTTGVGTFDLIVSYESTGRS